MIKFINKIAIIVLTIILLNSSSTYAADFNKSLVNIRGEINRDNLDEAIKSLKKITVTNENEQEQINILFGDIYLKINQPQKAEEFYNENLFT